MIKQIYTAITSQFQYITGTTISQIGLYNSQFDYLGDNDKTAKETVVFPCLLVEFIGDITYMPLSLNVQQTDECIIRIHIGTDTSLVDNDTSIFDLKDEVHTVLQGFSQQGFNKLFRVAERQDVNHSNINKWEIDYKTAFRDYSTYLYPNTTTITGTTITYSI